MLPACASLTIVAAISEESVMKQTLSPEPARVRRGQLRAVALGVGVSAMALACSFGEIDGNTDIDPAPSNTQAVDGAGADNTPGNTVTPSSTSSGSTVKTPT